MRSRFSIRAVAIVIFFAALWFVLFRQLSGEWSVNDQYGYGWFVPFFAAVLFWLRWEDKPKAESGNRKPESGHQRSEGQGSEVSDHRSAITSQRTDNGERITSKARAVAIFIAIAALLLLLPIRLFEMGNPDWRPLSWVHALCVVAISLVLLWSAGGAAWLRHFAFPVAFILVAVPWITPIEAPIIQGLMRVVAAIASETAALFGIPTQLEGTLIRIPNGTVGVNEACSGVRSFQTSLMIGLLFGEVRRLSMVRRVLLVLAAAAIAFLGNCARAFFLVWIAATRNVAAVDSWHDLAGYGIVALVFVGSLGVTWLLGKRSGYRLSVNSPSAKTEDKQRIINDPATNSSFILRPSFFMAAAGWLIAIDFAASGWYRAHETNLSAAERWDVHWPKQVHGLREITMDARLKSTLRFDRGGEVTWRDDGGVATGSITYFLFFFRWEPGTSTVLRARAHRPDACLPNVGWREIADEGISLFKATPNVRLSFRHFVFAHEAADKKMFAHTFFCIGEDAVRPRDRSAQEFEQTTGWSPADRWRVVREGIRNPGQQVMELVMVSANPISSTDAHDQFAQLLPKLIDAEDRDN